MCHEGMPAATAAASSCIGLVGEIGAVWAGRERADDDAAAAIEASSLSTCADTAGADFGTARAGFIGAGLFAAGFLAGELCAAGFFPGDGFAADGFAAGFFAAVLTAAFAPATVIPLPDALAATFLTGAGETPATFVGDLDTLAALPALAAVLRDFVETAMVSPESSE
jgi:hypothetical protein